MGKRSSFKKIDKDQYDTIDPRAVQALLPFLVKGATFAEPCYGKGYLSSDLVIKGMKEKWASDLDPKWTGVAQKDALNLTKEDLTECDFIITNPPWSRDILHPLIQHFISLGKPVWLLFDADWMHTKQSAELIDLYCTDIVSVGRLIWIPGTKVSGKDNCAWYRFYKHKAQYTIYHGRTSNG